MLGRKFIALFSDNLTDNLNESDVANPNHLVPCDSSNKLTSLQVSGLILEPGAVMEESSFTASTHSLLGGVLSPEFCV